MATSLVTRHPSLSIVVFAEGLSGVFRIVPSRQFAYVFTA
jgi:hypothetical protein